MFSDLTKLVRTKKEAITLSQEIELVNEALFQNRPEALEIVLKSGVSAPCAEILKNAFAKGVDKAKYLKQAKEALKKLKVISLRVAFDPTEDMIDKLFSWVTKNVGEGTILDITKDEEIIGGAIIVSQGHYLDFSLRKKIREFFSKQRPILTKYFQ